MLAVRPAPVRPRTDGGVRASWTDRPELFSADAGHLNLQGQAAEAAQLWPVVNQLLGM
jgi:hypothetical protein